MQPIPDRKRSEKPRLVKLAHVYRRSRLKRLRTTNPGGTMPDTPAAKPTKAALIAAIDGHVSAFLGFDTGLAGLQKKKLATLVEMEAAFRVMAEEMNTYRRLKAEFVAAAQYGEQGWSAALLLNDPATEPIVAHLCAANAIWGRRWPD